MSKLSLRILYHPRIQSILNKLKKTSFIGLEGQPVYDVAVFFWNAIQKGAIPTRAAAMSFKFFLALFPAIIFLFTLIPYIPVDNFQQELMLQLKNLLPKDAYSVTRDTMDDLINNKQGGLLSIGFLSALYFASEGVKAILNAFNESYYLASRKRSFWKEQLKALLLTFVFSSLVIIGIVLIGFSELVLTLLLDHGVLGDKFNYYILTALNWFSILALFYVTISVLYYFGAPKKTNWRFFTAGTTIATLLMIVTSVGFAWYVNNFGQYNKIYGSIGTLMVIMLWINLNAQILLIGFEFNTSIYQSKLSE